MTVRAGAELQPLRDLAAESAIIPGRALTLLLRHLPQLVTVICFGLAGRQAAIWLAVWLSSFSSFAASLVMPLAPLCVMVALIFSLWLLRPSLPFLAATFPDRSETSPKVRLLTAGGMLVSFLTVYATHGMLKEDLAAFRRAATVDEIQNQGFNADFSRAFVDSTAALIGLIVGTIVLRKIVGYFALAERGLGFTYFAAYLEVLWMSTVSVFLTNKLADVQSWALTRQSIAPAYHRYEDVRTGIEDSAGFVADAWNWLSNTLPAFNQLVTIPIAWLTLGAVVFGTSLAAKQAEEKAEPEEAAAEEAAAEEVVPEGASVRVRRHFKSAAKQEAKHAVDEALQPVAGPLKTTWKGLRTLARAGLVPMTIFCVIFMLATGVELGVVQLGRLIAGPQDIIMSEVVASYILVTARAAYLLVVVCLIASALDFFLRHSYAGAGGGESTNSAGSGSTKVT
ncbi:hypothetical protein M5J20_06715 [Corynebacterium sp. TA-R-1]|uniref:ABC transmembrane type-1 domain-containing protein n=1 Tax=Corynebacterium stercoris TaxID=2943490 RepID=A0ABT1G1H6_9CORY|nr:hypothetical protein [Corynebacterium stercoris]MCP1387882.1 hypothetical protein [Corynebacterium stercoris]